MHLPVCLVARCLAERGTSLPKECGKRRMRSLPKCCSAALALALLWLTAAPLSAGDLPAWLPRYEIDMHLDVRGHVAHVRERVTWTNHDTLPASELVFNAHAHYSVPKSDIGFLAKSLEILRVAPSEGLSLAAALEVDKVTLVPTSGVRVTLGLPGPIDTASAMQSDQADAPVLPSPRKLQPPPPRTFEPVPLPFHFRENNDTALVVPLPQPVACGQSVTVELEFTMHLAQKEGRWGQWKGVTFLVNWVPVLAFYDNNGWQPTPFIPWHLPFFNEAGNYSVRVTLACNQRIACSGSIVGAADLGDGMQQVHIEGRGLRDFAFLCCARFIEITGNVGPVRVHCLALPEHEYYAKAIFGYVSDALKTYSAWFGPYAYPDFTIVESYFGWNGNQCGGLVMIDARIFALPHLSGPFVDYLVSHETCHQWWYNAVGVNGYAETWMCEGLATAFGYRLMRQKYGKNDKLLTLPAGLRWLPNIDRETYRYYGLYGTLGRGEGKATVTEFTNFGHLVNLLSMTYDRGGKIVGMIEDRLGEVAFLDFMRHVYCKYQFRILRVADFERELQEYTGQPEIWQEFFQNWLYGAGMTDWCVEKVHVNRCRPLIDDGAATGAAGPYEAAHGYKVTVVLHQKAEYNDPTVLGFSVDGSDDYQIRIPVIPQALPMDLPDPPARLEALPDNRVQVVVLLPYKPTQIAVDPDQVLLDRDPSNNYWKTPIRWRITPLYTQLEETDLTTAYDRWNVILGPWVYGSSYDDPWFTRSSRAGIRAGLYRGQDFDGGAYIAYRPDQRDIVAGVDGLWDHFPWPHTQVGFVAERGLSEDWEGNVSDRAVLFGRYVFQYGSSLYLPPMQYVEGFSALQDFDLPQPRDLEPGAELFNHQRMLGLHYHIDYLTPYWDPEGGFCFDAVYASGLPILGEHEEFNRVNAQLSYVKSLPDGLGYLSQTRLAARVYGAAGLPNQGYFFTLGGSTLFRGFALEQRQGSDVWLTSLEWRLPLLVGLTWDMLDHTIGLRNVYGAAFTDAGEAFLNGHSVDGVAYDAGAGLRFDMAWFSLIERTIIRFDVAKAFNAQTPVQFWLALEQPF